jgi:hypothetical protein
MDHPLYEKINPKGNCYGYIHAVILPVRDRDIFVNMLGKSEICHPVIRVIFHSIL